MNEVTKMANPGRLSHNAAQVSSHGTHSVRARHVSKDPTPSKLVPPTSLTHEKKNKSKEKKKGKKREKKKIERKGEKVKSEDKEIESRRSCLRRPTSRLFHLSQLPLHTTKRFLFLSLQLGLHLFYIFFRFQSLPL